MNNFQVCRDCGSCDGECTCPTTAEPEPRLTRDADGRALLRFKQRVEQHISQIRGLLGPGIAVAVVVFDVDDVEASLIVHHACTTEQIAAVASYFARGAPVTPALAHLDQC